MYIVEAKIYLLLLLRSYLLLLPASAQFGLEQPSGPANPGNCTLYVEQRLLAIRFSPAIRFFKPTFGVIVDNNIIICL